LSMAYFNYMLNKYAVNLVVATKEYREMLNLQSYDF
jgi:hypothetical protein